MRNRTLLLAGAALGLAAAVGTVAFGQGRPGPFTQAQVDTGRQAYADNCALCHRADMAGTNDAPALTGSAFMGAWTVVDRVEDIVPALLAGPKAGASSMLSSIV